MLNLVTRTELFAKTKSKTLKKGNKFISRLKIIENINNYLINNTGLYKKEIEYNQLIYCFGNNFSNRKFVKTNMSYLKFYPLFYIIYI